MEEDRAPRPLSSRGTDLGVSLEPGIGDQLSSPTEVSPTTFCSESSTTSDENFGRNKQLGSLEENRFIYENSLEFTKLDNLTSDISYTIYCCKYSLLIH